MLRKLTKYEIKALSRVFIPLCIAMIILSIIVPIQYTLSNHSQYNYVTGLIVFSMIILFISTFIALTIFTITRFNKSLFADEGYLTFTIPVKTAYIILSKLLGIFFYYIVVSLSAFVSFIIIMLKAVVLYRLNIIMDVCIKLRPYITLANIGTIFNIFILVILSNISFIILIYASISLGQTFKYKKFKNIIAFAFFFLFLYFAGRFTEVIPFINKNINENFDIIKNTLNVNISFIILNIIETIKIVFLFYITTSILTKKLNLE